VSALAHREYASLNDVSPESPAYPRLSGFLFVGAVPAFHFVRQLAAKSRHGGRPLLASIFRFSHWSAQKRIRSRGARGSMGGGWDVSGGGSSASGAGVVAGAVAGLSWVAGGCAGAGGRCVGGCCFVGRPELGAGDGFCACFGSARARLALAQMKTAAARRATWGGHGQGDGGVIALLLQLRRKSSRTVS
jgi:hypothetical protein